MRSIWHGSPHECIGTTARVRDVSLRLASSRSNVAVFGSMSMKMGTQPKKRIARQVAKKV